ncbi:MAG: dihydroneopterin aldolase [Gammaproteobacteria bacterium]|nr:dihydroneopterin aldolase [Gammaproteobacteria bacterium]
MDTILIHGLQCDCVIGVWAWEKKVTQTLVLDIDLATDISGAADSDNLEDALDYKKIADRVIEYAEASRFNLIESLVERLAELIREEFNVSWVRIKLDKGGVVKRVKQVAVVIERGARQADPAPGS